MGDTLKEMAELVKGFVGDSGVCSDERAFKAINQARRLLWNKRAWTSQEEYVQICCVNDCFTLPNRYEQIKLAWVGNDAVSLADEWFNATNAFALNADQSCHRLITEVGGKHVLFRDYTTHFYRLGVMLESAEDIGVTLTFEVQDQYDTYHTIKVTGVNPPTLAQSDLLIKGVRSVSKPATKGRVRIYAYDTALEAKTLISVYQPNDVNPSFRRFKAPRTCECITLYASKRYFDLVAVSCVRDRRRGFFRVARGTVHPEWRPPNREWICALQSVRPPASFPHGCLLLRQSRCRRQGVA